MKNALMRRSDTLKQDPSQARDLRISDGPVNFLKSLNG